MLHYIETLGPTRLPDLTPKSVLNIIDSGRSLTFLNLMNAPPYTISYLFTLTTVFQFCFVLFCFVFLRFGCCFVVFLFFVFVFVCLFVFARFKEKNSEGVFHPNL